MLSKVIKASVNQEKRRFSIFIIQSLSFAKFEDEEKNWFVRPVHTCQSYCTLISLLNSFSVTIKTVPCLVPFGKLILSEISVHVFKSVDVTAP